MSLDLAFKRLSLRSNGICHQCRRAFASSARRPQQQSATGALYNSTAVAHAQTTSSSQSPRQPAAPTVTATPASPPSEHTTASRRDAASAQRTSTDLALAQSMVRQATAASLKRQEEQRKAELEMQYVPKDYEMQMTRRWRPGDVYAPHDLSGIEMAKWKKNRRKEKSRWDVLDQLGIDPREHYKNFSMMSEYMTDMGRIKHSRDTGLRPVNQRRMAKAIRRAIGMGLMPGVHRHPEILRIELEEKRQQTRNR